MDETGDPELIRAHLAGDRLAFDHLVLRHQRWLRTAVAGMLGSAADAADDIAQDVFIAALLDLHRYDPAIARFTTWLWGIARNQVRNHVRGVARRSHRERSLAGIEAPGEPWKEEPEADASEAVAALDRCLGRLGPQQRRLLDAHYREGRTSDEIAAADGRSGDAIRMALSRIRRALRACMRTHLGAAT